MLIFLTNVNRCRVAGNYLPDSPVLKVYRRNSGLLIILVVTNHVAGIGLLCIRFYTRVDASGTAMPSSNSEL